MGGEANALSPIQSRTPILFVQGAGDMWAPDGSGVLVRYLESSLGPDFDVRAPEMPDAETDPRYQPWRDRIDRELRSIDGAAVIVGHSLGASTVLRYLAEGPPPVPILGLFLVATPWWEREGWSAEYATPAGFEARLPDVPLFMYASRTDPDVPLDHLRKYEELLPKATVRVIDGSDHSFVNGLPELVDDMRSL
jgi:predicted alpha/beta hydrolase family esterase